MDRVCIHEMIREEGRKKRKGIHYFLYIGCPRIKRSNCISIFYEYIYYQYILKIRQKCYKQVCFIITLY